MTAQEARGAVRGNIHSRYDGTSRKIYELIQAEIQ